MSLLMSVWRRLAKQIVAIAIIIGLFYFTRLPSLAASEKAAMVNHFHFTRLPLPELTGYPTKLARAVHPSLEAHAAWISAVGASIALNDLDGDSLSNDSCYVDPRIDQTIIAPVPGTGNRYQPFALQVTNLPYNSKTMAPMGCLPADVNEDGMTDLLVYYWGRTPVLFLHQQQTNSPLSAKDYLEQELVVDGLPWYTNAATFADLDGDGHNDLIIGNYFQDNARILDSSATGTEEMQRSMSRADNGGKNRIFLWAGGTNRPSVKFQEVEAALDPIVAQGWTLAVGAADLDGDLLPEIYFANDFGPDRLLHNRSQPKQLKFTLLEGEKGFTTPKSKVLGKDSFKGMGVDFGDLNSDGWLDIYVSNITAVYALEESQFVFTSTGKPEKMRLGIAPYVDRSEPLGLSRSGWAWESKLGDFDNNGDLEALQATGFRKGEVDRWPELHELAMSNDEIIKFPSSWWKFQPGDDLDGHDHNPFFVKAANGRYYDLAPELALAYPEVTRAIATADVDGDGDLDFAVANQWERSYFYRNESPVSNSSLELRLLRPQVGSSPEELEHSSFAIGATAAVQLPDGHKLVAQVDGGNGHSGARSPELHFGLGKIPGDRQLPVEVKWRDYQGKLHQKNLQLPPGRHTVLLHS